MFRVASHSKTFTATVVHQLAERGVLGLDDPLSRWLPWTTGSAAGVATSRCASCSSTARA